MYYEKKGEFIVNYYVSIVCFVLFYHAKGHFFQVSYAASFPFNNVFLFTSLFCSFPKVKQCSVHYIH